MTLISSLAEVVSLGAVVPFIGILTQPEVVFADRRYAWVIASIGISSPAGLVVPLALAFAGAALLAGVLRLTLLWVSIRVGNATGADLGVEIFRRTLLQPYRVHISRNSSEIISAITQKAGTATNVLISLVTVLTSLILFLAILCTLLLLEPVVALIAMASFSVGYGVIAGITRARLLENGRHIAREQTSIVKALQEGLGAIRDVLLDSNQAIYTNLYKRSIFKLQMASAENTFFNQAPRFAMEALGIILIAIFTIFLSERSGGVGAALPALGMLALGAQRLLPLMQQIYGNWSVLNSSKAALVDVLDLLQQPDKSPAGAVAAKPTPLSRQIEFRNVCFRYVADKQWTLSNLNFVIPKGARVGIVGPTGCGKSTLMDLAMGLLEAEQGEILIDNQLLGGVRALAWQRSIAHVPQNIFLADATISENIAFGIPRENIDMARVHECAVQARLDDFVAQEDKGYDTVIGERGVRLSGGQKQRIGIARALYKNVSVLVLDEATSALDNETEASVMQAIENLSRDLTILIIAHRTTTLKNCDTIFMLEQGRLVTETSYKAISQANNAE